MSGNFYVNLRQLLQQAEDRNPCMSYSKSHEDWIIANVQRIREGNHKFSEKGVQLFMKRFHQIRERREMRSKEIFKGTKE
jgi:hypothetical protein